MTACTRIGRSSPQRRGDNRGKDSSLSASLLPLPCAPLRLGGKNFSLFNNRHNSTNVPNNKTLLYLGKNMQHTIQINLPGLLRMLGENIYAEPDVAIREMIQNAHDQHHPAQSRPELPRSAHRHQFRSRPAHHHHRRQWRRDDRARTPPKPRHHRRALHPPPAPGTPGQGCPGGGFAQ